MSVQDPRTGLEFVELSHVWGHGIPVWPGDPDVRIERAAHHSRFGVMSQRLTMNMHCGTHLNAPLHLVQRGGDMASLAADLFFRNGVVLDIPKGKWDYVTADDLRQHEAMIRPRDIVLIVTGWHVKHSESQEWFGHAPGLSKDAAQYLIERQVAVVGMDTAAIDHPMATSLALHRGGPLMKRLPQHYQQATGRDPKADFPEWNPAHRALLAAGIPTIEGVGGDVDSVKGTRCTIHALPWRWLGGDACVIRLMALRDPNGQNRIESGAAA